MKNLSAYLFSVSLLSVILSCFGGNPGNVTEFFMGFGICFAFWGGMLAPMLIDEKNVN